MKALATHKLSFKPHNNAGDKCYHHIFHMGKNTRLWKCKGLFKVTKPAGYGAWVLTPMTIPSQIVIPQLVMDIWITFSSFVLERRRPDQSNSEESRTLLQANCLGCYSETPPVLILLLDKFTAITDSSWGGLELSITKGSRKINQEAKSTNHSEVLEIQFDMFKDYEM